MNVLVCGGRDYGDSERLFKELDKLHEEYHFTLLIEGGQTGADRHGRMWARTRRIPFRTFHANWREFGRAAGPIRNQHMIDDGKPGLVVAFPGGKGTADMVARAHATGIKVVEVAP